MAHPGVMDSNCVVESNYICDQMRISTLCSMTFTAAYFFSHGNNKSSGRWQQLIGIKVTSKNINVLLNVYGDYVIDKLKLNRWWFLST